MLTLILAFAVLTFFSFWNGFTDAANSISTVIGSRVLTPIKAVALAALGNFLGVLLGVAVATTIGKGIINPEFITVHLVIAAICGGMVWDVITWFFGLPCSESHVLIGGLVGAGIAAGGVGVVNFVGVVDKVVLPMIFSPLIAIVAAFVLTGAVIWIFRRYHQARVNKYFNRLQIISSLFLSVAHGSNDAQKVVGIMTSVLVSYGLLTTFDVPIWVIILSYSAISLGTFFGGWRIVKTMAFKITTLKPYQGFCAEMSAASILSVTSHFGLPVSTTHAVSGSIIGVGVSSRLSAVRWKVARSIVWAWILTIPVSAVFSFIAFNLLGFFF